MTFQKQIRFHVNDEEWTLSVEPNDSLLDVLRDRCGAKSPKCGCERGDCGACTILLDNRTVRSCLILAVEADGRKITTVEGLSKQGLHPVQCECLDNNAFQCGYCAPGIVLSAVELLHKNKKPTREEIQEAIGGNLCRCTGYIPIIDAIEKASRQGG
jgi:carbon-monoxide dehydrogenase small subunit